MSFLNAEWRKLVLANYDIEASVLKEYVPFGTELDLRSGKCYISLVGFMFINTKLLGVKVPYHINFEEVNLRFYVKRKVNNEWRRGVVFIKEIVPKPMLTFVANTIYNEHYETLPMKHLWEEKNQQRIVQYAWKKRDKWQSIEVVSKLNSIEIDEGSEEEFITEHYWGYAYLNDHKSNEYEVTHPRWKAYPVIDYKIDVDFGITYGEQFSFMNNLQPVSVMLAEGSEITVENKSTIK